MFLNYISSRGVGCGYITEVVVLMLMLMLVLGLSNNNNMLLLLLDNMIDPFIIDTLCLYSQTINFVVDYDIINRDFNVFFNDPINAHANILPSSLDFFNSFYTSDFAVSFYNKTH
jgi:hypothetical protein